MNIFSLLPNIINQEIKHPILEDAGVSIHIKREDLIHPFVSGNKFRKLKYNLFEAQKQGLDTILTFGGAYSNHIAATAAAAKNIGLQSIGVIRGDELGMAIEKTLSGNPTLRFAANCNMQFKFVTRRDYKEKETPSFLATLQEEFGSFYHIPEGGTNELAIRGCEEILTTADANFDIICSPVGTAGTISGLINASQQSQKVLGFPALKGNFLTPEIKKYVTKDNWELIQAYHFGGYGKVNSALIEFINTFYNVHEIPLDPIYTSKMMYGLFDMVANNVFNKNTRILAVHTGGLQGVFGMNQKLQKKGLPLISV